MSTRGTRVSARPRSRDRSSALALSESARSALVLGAIMVAGFVLNWHYITRVTEWRVMTDELLYTKIALGMAQNLSPLPEVHGESVGVYSLLYPLLIAPLVGLFDMPTAFRAIHLLNVLLMVSTAIPAYLLTREVCPWRFGAWIVAGLSMLVPWMTQATSVMTEVIAYPLFAWAALAMVRAVARPSLRADVVALVAIGIACLGRTQFVVLGMALPVAIVLHEVGREIASAGLRALPSAVARGARAALRGHPLVAAATVVGLVLVASGATSTLLGNYATTVQSGSLLPAGILGSSLEHVAFIAVGVGVLPLVLAIAFVLVTLGRPVDPRAHALAAVLVVVVPALALAVASFDLRFNRGIVQERYIFYICPLLLAAAAGWFAIGGRAAWAVAVGAAVSLLVVLQGTYETQVAESFASPNRFIFPVFDGRSQQVGAWFGIDNLTPTPFIVAATVIGAALAAGALWAGRGRVALGAFGAVLGLLLAAQFLYVVPRVVSVHNHTSQDSVGIRPLAARDWIDDTGGGSVGIVQGVLNSRQGLPIFNSFADAATWWDVEFWNKDVDRAFGLPDRMNLTIGPVEPMRLDYATGDLRTGAGDRPSRLAVATSDVRFAPEFRGRPVSQGDMTLYDTPRPYRAGWATRGLDQYGWTRPDGATLRVFAARGAGSEVRRITLLLDRPDAARPAPRFIISGGGVRRSAPVPRPVTPTVDVCVPAGGHVDLSLDADRRTRQGERFVGYRVALISSRPTGRGCRASGNR